MDFSLTAEQREHRTVIVGFARERLNGGMRERDRAQSFSRELWLACGEMGLPGLAVAEDVGGVGLDAQGTAVALEALGYGCEDGGLVFALCAHLLACAVPLNRFGTREQRERFLPGMSNGTRIAVNAITEPESGSDASPIPLRAVADGAGFPLNGTQSFASYAP